MNIDDLFEFLYHFLLNALILVTIVMVSVFGTLGIIVLVLNCIVK